FHSGFDDAPIGMAMVDGGAGDVGRFVKVNRSLCYLLGYSEPELLATTVHALVGPDDREVAAAALVDTITGAARTVQLEVRFAHAGGRPLTLLMSSSVASASSGTAPLLIVHLEDIT